MTELTPSASGGLSEAERATWDVDPDNWPHTPPFHVFRALMDEDDNWWWRAGSGHGLNAYDAAIERVEELEQEAAARNDTTGGSPVAARGGIGVLAEPVKREMASVLAPVDRDGENDD